MRTQFKHLTESDRWKIESMLASGHSQRSVARVMWVSPSTISREVKRAAIAATPRYYAVLGQRARLAHRKSAGFKRRKLGNDMRSPCWQHVLRQLHAGWSPEQIAGRLKTMPSSPADDLTNVPYVCHETIYSAIYAQPRGTLRSELIRLLRKSHAGRLPRARGTARFTGIQGMTSIDLRPPEVAARIVPGHWEGDLIKGAANRSCVGTIVERTSRFIMLVKLDSASSSCVLEGFTRRLRSVPTCLRKTMTYDQGTEMASHATLSKRLRMDIFFCDPHSPWQRGTNENSNGLIREYLPKGMDLSSTTQQQLSSIEYALNHRPRKILGFRTPYEVFSELKLNSIAGVALQP